MESRLPAQREYRHTYSYDIDLKATEVAQLGRPSLRAVDIKSLITEMVTREGSHRQRQHQHAASQQRKALADLDDEYAEDFRLRNETNRKVSFAQITRTSAEPAPARAELGS